jgi:MFS family permease/predicted nucleic acid-binding protein
LKDQIGLSLADIFLLQAVFGLSVVLLELPSGYVADRAGYRRSLLVGAALWIVGWVIYTAATSFAGVMVAEVVLGGGSAFISGADRALLWVSLEAEGRQAQYTRWDGRVRAAAQVGEAGSAAIGGWLYSLAPRLPFWLQVPVALLAAGIMGASAIPRRDAPRRTARTSSARSSAHTLCITSGYRPYGPRGAQAVDSSGRLIQPAAQSRGVPPAWFGPLWAAAHAWLALVSLASARVVAALGVRVTLLGCCLLVPLGYVGLAASASAWGLGFYLCFMTIRGLQAPILTRIMQEHAPGEDRASVLSLAALLFRLPSCRRPARRPPRRPRGHAGGPRRARRRLHGGDARRARCLHPGPPRRPACRARKDVTSLHHDHPARERQAGRGAHAQGPRPPGQRHCRLRSAARRDRPALRAGRPVPEGIGCRRDHAAHLRRASGSPKPGATAVRRARPSGGPAGHPSPIAAESAMIREDAAGAMCDSRTRSTKRRGHTWPCHADITLRSATGASICRDRQRRWLRQLEELNMVLPAGGEVSLWWTVFDWIEKYADHKPDWTDGYIAALCGRDRTLRVWTYDKDFRTTWRRPDGSAIPLAIR